MKRRLLAAGILISSCMITVEAKAASFTGLNVFGDSLVDAGNLFNLTDTLLAPLGLPGLPPSPPYAQRNSNGPIWIETVGQELGLSPILSTDLVLNPATPPPTQGINFAFAGALSSDSHILDDDFPALAGFFPGLQDQIDSFAELSATLPVDPDALNVILSGGNDYNEAFLSPASLGGLSLDELPDFVTDSIVGGLSQLSSLGAQEFLVVNLPSIGDAPFADFLDAQLPIDIPATLNQLVDTHNALLSVKLDAFSQSQPDVNIITLDANGLFNDIVASPSTFGLTNVTDPCLINYQPGFQFDGVCDNPDEFLFWDDTHPTAAASQIIGDFALAVLADDPVEEPTDVPEPASLMAMMTLALIGSGRFVAKRSLKKEN